MYVSINIHLLSLTGLCLICIPINTGQTKHIPGFQSYSEKGMKRKYNGKWRLSFYTLN